MFCGESTVKPLNIVIINLISNSSIYYIFIIYYYVVVMITLFRCFSYLRENIQINDCLLQYCVILQNSRGELRVRLEKGFVVWLGLMVNYNSVTVRQLQMELHVGIF